jgi:hypothetical protein
LSGGRKVLGRTPWQECEDFVFAAQLRGATERGSLGSRYLEWPLPFHGSGRRVLAGEVLSK